MGVVRTDEWLLESWREPEELCRRLEDHYPDWKPQEIYQELNAFGMYRPSRQTGQELEKLIESGAWEKVAGIFEKYKQKWKGPDIPLFIFPAAKQGGFFREGIVRKSGLSYPDKVFLFLPLLEDHNEMEALFVHEYHHACRMIGLGKRVEDYTLLESMVMEGLAEHAVLHECGEEYLADWTGQYDDQDHKRWWEKTLKENAEAKKTEKIHERLLYGGVGYPSLLGYAAGFYLVEQYCKNIPFDIQWSFREKAEVFLPKALRS